MLVGQGFDRDLRPNRVQPVQNAKRVQPGQRPLGAGDHLLEWFDRRAIGSPKEHLMGHVALPSVGAIQGGNKAGRVERVQAGNGARFFVDGVNAVDATLIVARAEVERRQEELTSLRAEAERKEKEAQEREAAAREEREKLAAEVARRDGLMEELRAELKGREEEIVSLGAETERKDKEA